MSWLHRHKYLVLLITIGCLLIVQSIARPPAEIFTGGAIFSFLFIALIMMTVLLVVFEHRRDRIVALCVFLAFIVSGLVHFDVAGGTSLVSLTIVHYLLITVFLGYAVAVILRNIFKKGAIGADDVLGAVSGYLLAASAWSSLYALTDILVPGSFTVATGIVPQTPDWHGRTALFNYFSVVTLTTMGYGDITPTRAPATTLAMFEAVFGQFYIAIVVAQLVGARMAGAGAPDSKN